MRPTPAGTTGLRERRIAPHPNTSGAVMQPLRSLRPFAARIGATGVLAGLLAVLVLAGVAVAARPKHGARFSGFTSAAPINGFQAPVTFKVAANGLSLSNFTFGSFGCFGAGGFRPGVNPYTKSGLHNAGKVKVSASGRVSAKAVARESAAGTTTTFTITITARFSSPKKVSGTIGFTEVSSSGSFHASCTSPPKSFTAKAH